MDPERKREEIFAAAIEFEDHSERDAYIAQACGKDRRLFEKVRSLLDYHDGNSFLDVPALEVVSGTEISPLIPNLGEVIGRYNNLVSGTWWYIQRSGEGKDGWVWDAAVTLTGDIDSVPLRDAPPTPSP